MNANLYLSIAPLFNDCTNCGSDAIGNGKGSLEITDDVIFRSCQCGFGFQYDVKEDVKRGRSYEWIRKSIKHSLDEIKARNSKEDNNNG